MEVGYYFEFLCYVIFFEMEFIWNYICEGIK